MEINTATQVVVDRIEYDSLLRLSGRMEAANNYLKHEKYPFLDIVLLIFGLDMLKEDGDE